MRLMNCSDLIAEGSFEWLESEQGWKSGNVIYADPQSVFTLVPNTSVISPIAFKLRFTAPERVAIYQSTDLMVKDFISLLNDARLTLIDLSLKSTIDAIDYLVSIGLVGSTRKSEILS